MELKKHGPQLTADEVVMFEHDIGGKLADDYKQFLLKSNGGIPEISVGFKWEDDVEEVAVFYELSPRHDKGLRSVWRDLPELNIDGLLPIACNVNQQRICIDVLKDTGSVYFILNDYENGIPESVSKVRLARTFTEFIDRLVEIPTIYCRIEYLGKRGSSEDLAEYLSEGNSIDDLGKNDLTIVQEAIKFDNMPMMQSCIDAGASLCGAIYITVQNRRLNLIEKLIEFGADVNERNTYGKTPLGYVGGTALPGEEGARNREMRELLIKLGAVE